MSNLDKLIKRLSSLKQYKTKTKEEIEILAKESLAKKDILNNLVFCIDADEKKFAANLLDKYLSESSIESESDKDTLRLLIDLEVHVERIKSFLKQEYEKNNSAIPIQLSDELRKSIDQILTFKDRLGLTSINKEVKSSLEEWEQLKKKAINYYNANAGQTMCRCPECNHLFSILMDMSDKKVAKATFFKGTRIYNKKLFDLFKENKITKEDISEILGVSIYDIDTLYNEIYLKELQESKDNDK